MVLHTAPNLRSRILQGDWATIRDDYHWHIEITPEPEHANRVGGIFVNETRPEVSAAELRNDWPDQGESPRPLQPSAARRRPSMSNDVLVRALVLAGRA